MFFEVIFLLLVFRKFLIPNRRFTLGLQYIHHKKRGHFSLINHEIRASAKEEVKKKGHINCQNINT
jgi:hypothetical protein